MSSACATHGGVDLSTHEHSLVLVQLAELAEVREVVPDGFKLVPGNVAVAVRVKVLENGLWRGGINKSKFVMQMLSTFIELE